MPSRKSIGDKTAEEFRALKRHLKERFGIEVQKVDGPSEDDAQLRFLQELQQVTRAIEPSESAPVSSAMAETSTPVSGSEGPLRTSGMGKK